MLLRKLGENSRFKGGMLAGWLVIGLIFLMSAMTPAVALEPGFPGRLAPSQSEQTYISPVEEDEIFSLVVIGDSIGDGLWYGLTHSFRGEKNIRIVKKSRVSTGLVREDYYHWPEALENILEETEFQIAVVLFGTNDRQAIRTEDGIARVGTDEWRDIYRARVDIIMEQLKKNNVAVYWVGLPIMRSASFSRHADLVNRIVGESAAAHGVKFISTWDDFTDARGRYNAYGADIFGRKRKLRAGDGIHMTMQGYRKLAFAVELLIREDLAIVIPYNPGSGPLQPMLPTLRPQHSADTGQGIILAASGN